MTKAHSFKNAQFVKSAATAKGYPKLVDKHGKPTTCEDCQGTGFVGRIGIFEIIAINDQLRTVITQSESLPEIARQFRGAKMLYLQEQALRRVIDGTTAINEMVKVFSASKRRKRQRPDQKT